MPVIQPMPWDSRQLGLPVGRLMGFTAECMDQSLADYGLVFAHVPQDNQKAVEDFAVQPAFLTVTPVNFRPTGTR